MSADCRLLVEGAPRDGRWNMAFDEALLDAAAGRGEVILRVYRWAEPTLSLGHFQKSLPAELPERLLALPRVRRLSGGGAILHDREWTYSCAVPKRHPLAARTEALYEAAHESLISAFAGFGVSAAMRGTDQEVERFVAEGGAEGGGPTGRSPWASRGRDETFLCFERGDARDVVVAGRKVVGSAQRRRRGAVLQHGSVLLRASEFAPDMPGIFDLAPVPASSWGRAGEGIRNDAGYGPSPATLSNVSRKPVDDPLFASDTFVREFGRRLFSGEPELSGEPERNPHPGDMEAAERRAASYAILVEQNASDRMHAD